MILKGAKIYLQEGLREEDYALILKGYIDLDSMKFVSFGKEAVGLKNVDEARKLFHEMEDGIVFGIYTYENKFIGYSSLADIKEEECEFAIFILDKNYWGKGIGEEVMRMTLNYAFEEMSIEKIWLTTSEYHKNAIALYEKMGFKRTKLIPNDREIFLDRKWIKSGTVEMILDK